VRRAYKLRAYPTRPQEGRAAQLKEIRAADPDGQGRHSFTAQQQTLRRLNVVFAAYFKRVKAVNGKERRVGYPRFKPYQRFDQVLFVVGDGVKWEPVDGGGWAHATFRAVGRVKVSQHRPVVGRVKTLQFKREGRRWYVVVVTETVIRPLPPTGRSVGVDVGVARFLTTSDGQRDFHHKTARGLVDSCDTIALEDLRVAAMTATASGTVEAPGRNVAAKAGLNRSILDAGWTQFTRILVAKAESAGRPVIFVNPSSTSIDRHTGGARCVRPRQDIVVCPVHAELDADLNGARNIAIRAGLGSGQAFAA
jgi:putative transposase